MAITALGGIACRSELLDRGFRDVQFAAAVRGGAILRIRRGYFATPAAPLDGRVAVRLGGRVGCLSALRSYGLWGGFRDEATHITLPRNASRLRWRSDDDGGMRADRYPARPCRVHWRDRPVLRRPSRASSWRVELHEALSDAAGCAPRADVRAAFESAVAAGALRLSTAQTLLDASWSRERAPMTLLAGSGSGAESHLVEILLALRVAFVQQVEFAGVARVDALVERCLVIEVDGYRYHAAEPQFEADRRRDARLLALGYPVLRLPARTVVEQPELATRLIVEALATVRRARLPRRR